MSGEPVPSPRKGELDKLMLNLILSTLAILAGQKNTQPYGLTDSLKMYGIRCLFACLDEKKFRLGLGFFVFSEDTFKQAVLLEIAGGKSLTIFFFLETMLT